MSQTRPRTDASTTIPTTTPSRRVPHRPAEGTLTTTSGVLLLVAVLSGALLAGCTSTPSEEGKGTLVIFHHGSPTPGIEAAEKEFEKTHPGVKVMREKGGALENMRKVTDLGRHADVVYTDDYSIIPPVMFPDDANFWIRYAHDEMTLAYGSNSKYANEVTADNWYEILQRPDVKWGIADPNAGPDGYFSVGQIALSNAKYGDDMIFHDLLEENTAIRMTTNGGQMTISCPEDLKPKTSKVVVAEDPETLYPMILAGDIDYAFGYMGSVIGEGPDGIKTVDLPKEVDLSDLSLVKSTYNKITMVMFSDSSERKLTVTLGAKANGLTIPSNADHSDYAVDYLKIFFGPIGDTALQNVAIQPLSPPETNDLTKVPADLRGSLKQGE